MHRTFRLRSKEESSVLGIDAYRFRVEDVEFQPNPDYKTPYYTPIGLIYLGVLQTPEVPLWGSKPHFLDCDTSLHDAVEGIRSPDRNKDDIYVDIEPVGEYNLFNINSSCGTFCVDHWLNPWCTSTTSG